MKVIILTLCLAAFAAGLPYKLGSTYIGIDCEDKNKPDMFYDSNCKFHYVDKNSTEYKEEIKKSFHIANIVIFRVFTRRNPTDGQIITLNNAASLSNSQYNSTHPTRFIIHGWNNNGGSPVNTAIRDAYLNRGEFNVITVDWGVGAKSLSYCTSFRNMTEVALRTANFIDWMNQIGRLAFNRISVIGHSLGGHAAGIVGKNVKRGRIRTVVALDPPRLAFPKERTKQRVTPDDAEYVEVIHTAVGLIGYGYPIGTADFYPNWGHSQPGCSLDFLGCCSHARAYKLFAESINKNGSFLSTQCSSYKEIENKQCTEIGKKRFMGGEPSQHGLARGIYYVETNGASPFARFKIFLVTFFNFVNICLFMNFIKF